MTKVLIAHASAGAGHRKAAEAIHEALSKNPDCEVEVKDSLEYPGRLFKWVYAQQYLTLISYCPLMWGLLYYSLDNWKMRKIIAFFRRLLNGLFFSKFEDFICNYQPDVIISTHFMTSEIISHMKSRGRLKCRLITAVTDFKAHTFWVNNGVDVYTVAIQQTADGLIKKGVQPERIIVTGIPVSLKFEQQRDKQAMRKTLSLREDLFTALIVGGGFGVGPFEKLTDMLTGISGDLQVLVVCGKNKDLFNDLQQKFASLKNVKIFGFVDNMHELMAASDILISKSGGLTTSEALKSNIPMIVLKPIPGQEAHNCQSMVEAGAGIRTESIAEVRDNVSRLIEERGLLDQMREAVVKIRHPHSAERIVEIALKNE